MTTTKQTTENPRHPSKSTHYPAGCKDERERVAAIKSAERLVNTKSHLIDRYSVRGSIEVRIRKRRMELELSQETLASLLNVSRETISQFEIGKSRIDAADLPRLCVALDVPLAYFFEDIYTHEKFPNAAPVHDLSALYDRLDDPLRRVWVDVAMSLWQNQPTRVGDRENEEEAKVAKSDKPVL